MKNIIITIFFLFFVFNANTQIHITNSSSEPIFVAIAYYKNTNSFSGWVSEGWWKIIPGETKVCGSFLKDGDNTYYIHAHTAGLKQKWGNDAYLAVNSVDAFKIENCDKPYVLKGQGVVAYQFTKKYVHIGLLDLYKDYVNYTD